VEAARLLTYRAAWLRDQGRKTTLESSMVNSSRRSQCALRTGADLGGAGFVKDYPAEK
jgi:alkylation response protein AidB-like acyl-CoA dehydrogenase